VTSRSAWSGTRRQTAVRAGRTSRNRSSTRLSGPPREGAACGRGRGRGRRRSPARPSASGLFQSLRRGWRCTGTQAGARPEPRGGPRRRRRAPRSTGRPSPTSAPDSRRGPARPAPGSRRSRAAFLPDLDPAACGLSAPRPSEAGDGLFPVVEHLEDRIELRQCEELLQIGADAEELRPAPLVLRRRQGAHEGAEAGRIDETEAGAVDEQVDLPCSRSWLTVFLNASSESPATRSPESVTTVTRPSS